MRTCIDRSERRFLPVLVRAPRRSGWIDRSRTVKVTKTDLRRVRRKIRRRVLNGTYETWRFRNGRLGLRVLRVSCSVKSGIASQARRRDPSVTTTRDSAEPNGSVFYLTGACVICVRSATIVICDSFTSNGLYSPVRPCGSLAVTV